MDTLDEMFRDWTPEHRARSLALSAPSSTYGPAYSKCACGYVTYDIQRQSDDAHDELCDAEVGTKFYDGREDRFEDIPWCTFCGGEAHTASLHGNV